MRKLDPQLEFLVEGGIQELDGSNVLARFGVESFAEGDGAKRSKARKAAAAAEVVVLVQYAGDPEELEKTGLKIRGIAGDVVTGSIALDAIPALAELGEVERMESARAMHPELDLSLVECRANLVHTGPPGRRGAGVIIGIVDSGCDYTHNAFRRSDGTSRILMIWDQGLNPQAGESSPAGFGYGVEYSNAQINAALLTANPFASVRHQDSAGAQFHGTHVTGIAAGDGSDPDPVSGKPANTFVGVAPEADIIIVADAANGNEGLGTSANTLDAVNYIFQQAAARSKACAVNMSLGDNLGPHDGTSLLERGLDNLLGGAGRAFVKSAGNAGNMGIHAQGNIVGGATQDVRFNQPANDLSPNQFDIWYEGGDTFRASVIDPLGNATGVVNVGNVGNFTLAGGNTVRIDHRNNDPFNGDRRIFITITRGTAPQLRAGNWTIRLRSVTSATGGRFDAWIQRGTTIPAFLPPHEDRSRTISTPGTAIEVITAANYITRGAGVGSLASSSSRGPTRDGRAAPTVAAPGSSINSASGHTPGTPYKGMGGTSMSAPHVTGTIALMFQKNKYRTQAQIKACLESSARSDAFTGPVPNTAWGAGKMDSNAAVNCVPSPASVPITTCPVTKSVVISCPTKSVLTPCLPSVASPCIPSVATPCVSLGAGICQPSVLVACPSIPMSTCPIKSVASPCQTIPACPSAIDSCPSAPGGCHLDPRDPRYIFVKPGFATPLDPRVAQPGGGSFNPNFNTGNFGFSGGQEAEGGEMPGSPPSPPQQPELPSEGYFEYDDNWFDEDGQ
jgi:subtilisin family serine protease